MKINRTKGRPAMETGRRDKKIDVRFTEAEYLQLLALEKQLGISKTELIRIRVLDKAAGIVVNAQELIRVLDGVGVELNRAGNNINQLARHVNTLSKQGQLNPEFTDAHNKLLGEWIRNQDHLEATLRKLIRMMSR